MTALFILFLLIDIILAFYLFKEAYVVRSNMSWKYKRRFAMLAATMVAAVAAYAFSPVAACFLAGLPAIATSLFALFMLIAFATHKGPWR